MVKYTPQKDWIEGHGIMIAFAFFLGGISGGLYLASVFFDSLLGMFVAWVAAGVMGLVDMAHLSKPMRFWRMMLKPKTSWIARGFIFIILFLGSGAIQLILSFWFSGTGAETVFKVLAGIMAFGVAIYSGFVVGYVGAIKIWNSATIPILFVVAGVTGGMAVLLIVNLGETTDTLITTSRVTLIMLVAYAFFMAVYLWATTYSGIAAKYSVMRVLRGNIAPIFWLGVVLIGIIVPIAILAPLSLSQQASTAAFVIAAVFVIIGGVALRYVILKAGIYSPLLPSE